MRKHGKESFKKIIPLVLKLGLLIRTAWRSACYLVVGSGAGFLFGKWIQVPKFNSNFDKRFISLKQLQNESILRFFLLLRNAMDMGPTFFRKCWVRIRIKKYECGTGTIAKTASKNH
jgi:hypothetical protein